MKNNLTLTDISDSDSKRLLMAGLVSRKISHKINNLLTPLFAFPEIIKNNLNNKESAYEMLDNISDIAHDLAELNKQMSSIAGHNQTHETFFCVNNIIQEVCATFEETIKNSDIRFKLDMQHDIQKLYGNSNELFHALNNICTNAIEAIDGKGEIDIHTEDVTLNDQNSKLAGKIKSGSYVHIRISDTGAGIPEELMKHIFEPFATTKENTNNLRLGLGLTIVDVIIKSFKGYVDLEKGKTIGTICNIYIPATIE